MKRLLATLLMLLCFGLAVPLVNANPVPVKPLSFFFWALPILVLILACFVFLILLLYYMNKISNKKKLTD
jgi:hypothetical protein